MRSLKLTCHASEQSIPGLSATKRITMWPEARTSSVSRRVGVGTNTEVLPSKSPAFSGDLYMTQNQCPCR